MTWPSPLPYFFFFIKKPLYNKTDIPTLTSPLISTQLILPQLFRSQQHFVWQHLFWLKLYYGFFILSKQIYFFKKKIEHNFKMLIFLLHIFVVYVFCLGVYLFYCFFSNKLVYGFMILYMLWFVLNFVKLYLFVKCWNLSRITDLGVLWWNKQ
jgi:hypothetical protein